MKTINLTCNYCNISFNRKLSLHLSQMKLRNQSNTFCSQKCKHNFYRIRPKEINCKQCNSLISSPKDRKFCNQSCSAKYFNARKTKCYSISKLEIYIQKQLIKLFSDLKILFNDRLTLGLELDIYIPSLKLAFEINGIFHYKPIFGKAKLKATQKNDRLKKSKCKELGIKLITINTSNQKYFTEKTSKKYLNRIIKFVADPSIDLGAFGL